MFHCVMEGGTPTNYAGVRPRAHVCVSDNTIYTLRTKGSAGRTESRRPDYARPAAVYVSNTHRVTREEFSPEDGINKPSGPRLQNVCKLGHLNASLMTDVGKKRKSAE